MHLSVIIPAYNAQKTIVPLLTSLYKSRRVDWENLEIIVVDDASSDNTMPRVLSWMKTHRKISVRTLQLKKNSGPAHARNVGVKYAKGKIVLFLDSDVSVYPLTLFELLNSFGHDPDLYALTGVWDKAQKTSAFFPNFKALRDWSYWLNERDPRHYYYLFSTRVAAINRKLFIRLGGFNEAYRGALVEDIELTYRIAKRYAVVFNPKVIVAHEFEGFWSIAKKYFFRSFYWSRIYRERKKFDPVATTGKEAVTTISAVGVLFFLLLILISYLIAQKNAALIAAGSCFLFLLFHFWGVRKFLLYTWRQKGLVFSIKAFLVGFVLYLVIFSGAALSFLTHPKTKK